MFCETVRMTYEGRPYYRNEYGNWFQLKCRADGRLVPGNVTTETHEALDLLAAFMVPSERADLVLNA